MQKWLNVGLVVALALSMFACVLGHGIASAKSPKPQDQVQNFMKAAIGLKVEKAVSYWVADEGNNVRSAMQSVPSGITISLSKLNISVTNQANDTAEISVTYNIKISVNGKTNINKYNEQSTFTLKNVNNNWLIASSTMWSNEPWNIATVTPTTTPTPTVIPTTPSPETPEPATPTSSAVKANTTKTTSEYGTAVQAPQAFKISEPNTTMMPPSFVWTSSKGADSYTLEIATSKSFGTTDVLKQENIRETSYNLTTSLDWRNVYYWRVTAVNSRGQTASSTWSWHCANLPIDLPMSFSPNDKNTGLAITPDGKYLIMCFDQKPGKVLIIALEKQPVITAEIAVKDGPKDVRVTPDGRYALVWSVDDYLNIIDLTNNSARTGYNIGSNYVASQDNQHIYTTGLSPTHDYDNIYVKSFTDFSTEREIHLGEKGDVFGSGQLAISPDGRYLYDTTWYHGLVVIDLTTSSVSRPPIHINCTPNSLKISPDGKTAVYYWGTGYDRIDLTTYQDEICDWNCSAVAFSSDSTMLLTMSTERSFGDEFSLSSLKSGAGWGHRLEGQYLYKAVTIPNSKMAIVLTRTDDNSIDHYHYHLSMIPMVLVDPANMTP